MVERRDWVVNLTATTEHEYRVVARSAEEAETEAEQLFDSGDEGTVISTYVEECFAAPEGDTFAEEELDEDIEFES